MVRSELFGLLYRLWRVNTRPRYFERGLYILREIHVGGCRVFVDGNHLEARVVVEAVAVGN
jgi:hypothetical protein